MTVSGSTRPRVTEGDAENPGMGNNRVQKFTRDGEFVTSWTPGDAPVGVSIGPDGNVYVSTFMGYEVFTPDGLSTGGVGIGIAVG